MSKDAIYGGEDVMNDWTNMLDLQARTFADKEINWMASRGLGEAKKPILDLGGGIGIYAEILKQHFKSNPVIITDNNKEMFELSQKRIAASGHKDFKAILWDTLNEPMPTEIKNCGYVVSRLVLQFFKDPSLVLKLLKDNLPSGTLIFLIDEEDELMFIEPDLNSYWRIFEIWNEARKTLNVSINQGRKNVICAKEAGLKIVDVDVMSHTNIECSLNKMIDYFISTTKLVKNHVPHYTNTDEIKKIENDFRNYAEKNKDNCLVSYTQMITAAKIP